MAAHSWVADAPSGVYKNHKLSSSIRMAAIEQAKFMAFVKPEPGYGRKMGESITITRVSNVSVPTSDVLNENVRIPEDNVSLSTQAITVSERGRAIPYTSLALDLSNFDLENAIQAKLRDQLALAMDITASAAFKEGLVKAIPSGVATTTFDVDGTPSTAATSNLNMYHVEQIRDYMYGTLNIAPFSGDDYVCIMSYKAKRGLMNDPKWVDWKKYTDPSAKYNGEVGRIENIRFVEQNHTSALSATKGTGSVLGEAVFFGADPVVMAVVQDPELRAKESEDYGRSKGVAWYGIYGFGQVWGTSANAGEARVVHLTSS
jgi:N4-gp56 family major capsid protein